VYRWSFRRDLGDVRLVVVDSRAARVLEPKHRSMLDPDEMSWLDEQLTGDVEHLLIGTSLPFMLPPGLHDLEAIDEVLKVYSKQPVDWDRAREILHELSTRNKAFDNLTPVEVVKEWGFAGLLMVRGYLDRARGV
jgi:hypothetical protein